MLTSPRPFYVRASRSCLWATALLLTSAQGWGKPSPPESASEAAGLAASAAQISPACALFSDQLSKTGGDPEKLSALLAPAKLPRWRYRSAKKKLFGHVAPAAAEGKVEALYTGKTLPPNGMKAPVGFNCEHLWPRAWMGGRRDPHFREKESDLHNLFPSEIEVNSRRGHLSFGRVKEPSTNIASPSQIGRGEERGERIEPRPERRGDVARALVYMAARWKMSWPTPHRALLAEWSHGDPPDDRERRRNEQIASLQGNPNPLVSCPEALPKLLELLDLP